MSERDWAVGRLAPVNTGAAAGDASEVSPYAPVITRRTLMGALALPWLAGCATPLPLNQRPANADAAARTRLLESSEAHGVVAYRTLTDINIAYAGEWRPLIGRIQPELVDSGFRGTSQERLLPAARVVAQSYTGAQGRKYVWWKRGSGSADLGEVGVWFNGVASADPAAREAAALVAECYGLFLLGPLWLLDRPLSMRLSAPERVDGRLCDVLDVWLEPGLGRVAGDRIALYIDQGNSLMRRLRFTLEGFSGTKGAVAEVDTFEHERRFGVIWPMRSYERVVHPIALPAHDWRIVGLDVNRGYLAAELAGPTFRGRAADPATLL